MLAPLDREAGNAGDALPAVRTGTSGHSVLRVLRPASPPLVDQERDAVEDAGRTRERSPHQARENHTPNAPGMKIRSASAEQRRRLSRKHSERFRPKAIEPKISCRKWRGCVALWRAFFPGRRQLWIMSARRALKKSGRVVPRREVKQLRNGKFERLARKAGREIEILECRRRAAPAHYAASKMRPLRNDLARVRQPRAGERRREHRS